MSHYTLKSGIKSTTLSYNLCKLCIIFAECDKRSQHLGHFIINIDNISSKILERVITVNTSLPNSENYISMSTESTELMWKGTANYHLLYKFRNM